MAGPPVVPVSATKAVEQAVPTELRVVGTVEASAIVQIKSQIAGELTSVNFTEGQNVAKGELLFRIDSRPYQDALAQAEAAIERDKAQIAQAEASLARDNAQANYAAVGCRPPDRTSQWRPHFETATRSIALQCRCRQGLRASHPSHYRQRPRGVARR